jgi:hypothetical protein
MKISGECFRGLVLVPRTLCRRKGVIIEGILRRISPGSSPRQRNWISLLLQTSPSQGVEVHRSFPKLRRLANWNLVLIPSGFPTVDILRSTFFSDVFLGDGGSGGGLRKTKCLNFLASSRKNMCASHPGQSWSRPWKNLHQQFRQDRFSKWPVFGN